MTNTDLLKPSEASEYTRLSVANLAQMRYLGKGPKYLKPTPRVVLYRRADLDAWLEGSERQGTAEGAVA
ncbi:helix-turn-helix transcriptional regulator [Pseudoclavibacter sp. CFCC 14310]|uniref:helix-turn-helix transcriptional regulator n=1 Tax=Pseudoclavibacter sp. CFCC 14310 TaxID=2615180 RepID=UPI001CE483C9|nr:helix-turn-helix domain-containing protein [Pseudoclavibacter sp. CFCC 14310]